MDANANGTPPPESVRAVDRRTLIKIAGLAVLPLARSARAWAQTRPTTLPVYPEHAGLILQEKEPLNLEWPFQALHGYITPNESFFVRNHFAMPKLDLKE